MTKNGTLRRSDAPTLRRSDAPTATWANLPTSLEETSLIGAEGNSAGVGRQGNFLRVSRKSATHGGVGSRGFSPGKSRKRPGLKPRLPTRRTTQPPRRFPRSRAGQSAGTLSLPSAEASLRFDQRSYEGRPRTAARSAAICARRASRLGNFCSGRTKCPKHTSRSQP